MPKLIEKKSKKTRFFDTNRGFFENFQNKNSWIDLENLFDHGLEYVNKRFWRPNIELFFFSIWDVIRPQ